MVQNNVYTEKQPKLWLAILSAIGMGIVGCLLWGLLYYVGYIAWAAAIVIIFGAAWAYKKFNLKMDKKGYVIISVISIVEVILTMFITLNIACMIELAKADINVSFFECFKLMFEVVGSDGELQTAVIIDAVLSLVCIAIGLIVFFFVEKRMAKQQQEKKLQEEKVENKTEISIVEEKKDEEIKK